MARNYFNLENKIALVTGASSGLGVHFANILAAEGATVILAARRMEKLQDAVNDINEKGGKAVAISLDVADKESVAQAFAKIKQDFGTLDILINNAGVANDPTSCLKMSEDDWNWVIDTNLTGAFRVAQAAAKLMVDAGNGGSIVNTASVYGLRTGAMKVNYNAAKAGVVMLSKSLAAELSRHNIRVNSLCPGWFLTEINEDYFNSESGKRYIQNIPAKRLGTMDELTVPLLLLASASAGSYMNGTCIIVDGGFSEAPM
ncbi:SDR family oxidoreductase [Spongiibacter sp. KMU-158]|uniref:SDR family oxidoreductase n=1 Tax=Spongiibacter pelagi TaxID=2760804 RepID=A0A927C1Z7_9GAMM|nr:SDR family oxidoreductase [Spongiibacter pelagi]MBD2859813.1 SDR family oxidoreductase [Spongiibacter pelagi]